MEMVILVELRLSLSSKARICLNMSLLRFFFDICIYFLLLVAVFVWIIGKRWRILVVFIGFELDL